MNVVNISHKQHCLLLCTIDYLFHKFMSTSGADPGFQVRGGALTKIVLSGGRRDNVWCILCEKITILRKNIIFFSILGGVGVHPPLDPPLYFLFFPRLENIVLIFLSIWKCGGYVISGSTLFFLYFIHLEYMLKLKSICLFTSLQEKCTCQIP